jgi:hypothetical protein
MAAEPVVGISAEIRLEQLRQQLAAIPELGSEAAKDLTRQLSKELKAAEAAARKAAASGKDLGDAYKRAGDIFGKTGQAGSKLSGILGVFSPRAAEAARTLNDIGDGGEVATAAAEALGLSLGGLGMAVAAAGAAATVAYGAWLLYAHGAEVAREQQELLTTALKEGAESSARIADLDLELQVATGKKTAEEAKYERAVRAAGKSLDERTDKAIEAAKKENASFSVTKETLGSIMTDLSAHPEHFNELDGATKKLVTTVGIARNEQEQTVTVLGKVRDAELADKAAKDAKTKALKEEAEWQARLTARIAETNAAYAAEAAAARQNAETFSSTMDGMQRAETTARTAQLTGIERIEAAREQDLADEEARLRAGRAVTQENTSARETLEEQHRQTLKQINARYDAEAATAADELAKKRAEAAAAAAAAAVQAGQDTVNALGGYVQQGLDMVEKSAADSYQIALGTATRLQTQLAAGDAYYTAAQKEQLQQRAEAARRQAIAAFNTDKGVKMVSIATAGALGAVNALAQNPPPSPLGAIGAGMVLASTAAAEAEVAATQPSFHSGGDVRAPDEVNAKLRAREMVANPTGASLGGAQIAAWNAGMHNSGGTVIAVTQYQHTAIADRYTRDRLRRNDPVAQALRSTSRPGMEA